MTTGSVAGVVVDVNGRPVMDAQVIIATGPAHPDIAAVTDRRGRFLLAGLSSGRYIVQAGAIGWQAREVGVTIPPGGQVRIEIRLNRRDPGPAPDGIEELPGDDVSSEDDQEGIPELPGEDPPAEVPIPEEPNRPRRQPRRDQPTEEPIPEEPNRPKRSPR